MADSRAVLTWIRRHLRGPLGVHDLLPEVWREAVHVVIQRPPYDTGVIGDYISGTLTDVSNSNHVLDLSPIVGVRACHMACIQFTFANDQLNTAFWQVRVAPHSKGGIDELVLLGELIPMTQTIHREHCMDIGKDGKIIVNFLLSASPTDDITYVVKVKWFTTTVKLRTLPVP